MMGKRRTTLTALLKCMISSRGMVLLSGTTDTTAAKQSEQNVLCTPQSGWWTLSWSAWRQDGLNRLAFGKYMYSLLGISLSRLSKFKRLTEALVDVSFVFEFLLYNLATSLDHFRRQLPYDWRSLALRGLSCTRTEFHKLFSLASVGIPFCSVAGVWCNCTWRMPTN